MAIQFPINDESCGWREILPKRSPLPALNHDTKADWAIIGAGFTGLASAYRLAELRPNDKIVLIDAEQAGAGASSRNSGYIVDSTLNDGGRTQSDLTQYRKKFQLNLAGIDWLRQQVKQFDIDCNWDESGKFHACANPANRQKLEQFSALLSDLEIEHQCLESEALAKRLGTHFYHYSVHTDGGVLVNPAALIDGLIAHLPENIALYENTAVTRIEPGAPSRLYLPQAVLRADRVIVAVNALMPSLGLKQNHVFPLTLTASMTRPLTETEYTSIGKPAPWGALSVHPMGATVRLTDDQRIMVRNTVESWPGLKMNEAALAKRKQHNIAGLRKRFPTLEGLDIDYSWSGSVCISRNTKPVFEQTSDGIYLAGCYNAGGVAMGSLFGRLIVDYALGGQSDSLTDVLGLDKPTRLPPEPLMQAGLKSRLAYRRFRGRSEA